MAIAFNLEDGSKLEAVLEVDILQLYGPVLTGDALLKTLGYISKEAFKQSMVRNTVPVPIFRIDNRRGHYALTKDVAHFLAESRNRSFNAKNQGGDLCKAEMS